MKSKILGLLAVGLLSGADGGECSGHYYLRPRCSRWNGGDSHKNTQARNTFDNLLPTLDDQVWWGNKARWARAFTQELGLGLGFGTESTGGWCRSPFFAFGILGGSLFE